jgi:hypothetical protein
VPPCVSDKLGLDAGEKGTGHGLNYLVLHINSTLTLPLYILSPFHLVGTFIPTASLSSLISDICSTLSSLLLMSEFHRWRIVFCNYSSWSDGGNHYSNTLYQRGQTGGSRATSGPRPLITRPAKLFVNLLLATISSFFLFQIILKNLDSYLVCQARYWL